MRLAELARWSTVVIIAAPRDPAFDVDHVGVLLAQIARAALQQSIRQFKRLQQLLDDADHRSMMFAAFRFVGSTHHDLLDLVELVDAVQTSGVLARGARFAAEAGRDGGVFQGQQIGVDDLVGVQTHQADFTGAGEVQILAGPGRAVGIDVVGLLAAAGEEAQCRPWPVRGRGRVRRSL